MRLRNAYLQAFGKFIDTNITFDPTINLIFGDNESGKSTLAEFIFNMLYGQKRYGVKRRIYTNSYHYNKPWQHSLYQGVLQYTLDKEEYRVERNFYREFEEIKIYSESTGRDINNCFKYDTRKELQFFNEQIGLSERIFKNTIYISQSDIEGQLNKNKDNVLEEILGKTVYGVESEQGEKTIIESIDELKKIKRDLGTENNKNKPLGIHYEKLREKLTIKYELENKMKLNSQYKQFLKEVVLAIDTITEEKEKLNTQKKYLENKNIENKINRIESLINQKEDLIDYIKKNFTDAIKNISTESINQQRKENQKIIKNAFFFIFTMFVMTIGIVIWLMASPKYLVQVFILITTIFISIIKIIKWRHATKNEEYLLNQLEKVNQYQDAVNELKYLQNKIEAQTSDYSLEQLKGKVHFIRDDLSFSKSNLTKLDIELELEKLEKNKIELANTKISYQVRMQENKWNPLELEQVEKEIYDLKNTIKYLEEDIQAIDIAIDTLTTIEKEKKSKWLPGIIKNAQANIYKITKKYHTIKIDNQYQIKTLEPKTQKLIPIEQLSKGTFNQFYFALRMSMIQILSSFPIQLPIILDEPFVNFDENRFQESMNLLQDLSEKHQVIIFTSQTKEKGYLDQCNCNYNFIEL